MVKDILTEDKVQQLRAGVSIKIKGGVNYITQPCEVTLVNKPANIPEGDFKPDAGAPHSWLTISLTEGKYHQVRKMLAAVKHPVRRLIRVAIDDLEIGDLKPGEVREVEEEELFRKLRIGA